eukprot:scaffold1301_cov128-Cylindrotheca_fusiformis.AAC.5
MHPRSWDVSPSDSVCQSVGPSDLIKMAGIGCWRSRVGSLYPSKQSHAWRMRFSPTLYVYEGSRLWTSVLE